jgi:hypothetical protein
VPELTGNLLGASANFTADDWLNAGASAGFDFTLAANLRRGIDVGAGAQALVALDASIRKFIAADVTGEAHAAARVGARVQVPLDLFDEAGAVVRAEAVAEAAASISLAIGLSIGDFLELAGNDPHMRGVPLQLLRILLEETTIQGGVMAKASAAAMAYASIAMTGRLIESGDNKPGFTVAAEAGVGLKAGAGFKVFARLGVDDPRRLIRRTIDIAVDETLAAASAAVPEDIKPLVAELRTPAKIGLRSAVEVGFALAEQAAAGSFNPDAGPALALRCVQVALEEAQRDLLERVTELAINTLRTSLPHLPITDASWAQCQAQRNALASLLDACPLEPFEDTAANRQYWLDLARAAADVGAALGTPSQGDPWLESASAMWAAAQLIFVTLRRVSSASARADIIGLDPASVQPAFEGPAPDQPPPAIRAFIASRIGASAGSQLSLEQLVEFILRTDLLRYLPREFPDVSVALDLLAGADRRGLAAAVATILENIGAFAVQPNGTRDAEASLRVLVQALQQYFDARVNTELLPAINAALDGQNAHVRTFLDEVLLDALRFSVGTVFDRVLHWADGDVTGQTALREACSAIVMRLFSRGLVATGDILLTHALAGVHNALGDAASHVNDAGGVAPVLASLTGLPRADLAELMEETLLVCADTFRPLPETKRARIRELLYVVLDTAPPAPDAAFVDQLRSDTMVPNFEAAAALSFELGGLIAEHVVRFITALLERVAARLLELLLDVVRALAEQVARWIAELEALLADIAGRLRDVVADILRFGRQLEEAGDVMLGQVEHLLTRFSNRPGDRTSLRNEIRKKLRDEARGMLNDVVPFYSDLPSAGRTVIKDALDDAIALVIDGLFAPVIDAVGDLAAETADFVSDLRAIEPGDNLTQAITDLFLDRLEDTVRAAFGYDNPGVDIGFHVRGSYRPPKVFGQQPPRITIDIDVDLGRVEVPLNTIVQAVRSVAEGLASIEAAIGDLATSLATVLALETSIDAAEVERVTIEEEQAVSNRRFTETYPTVLDAIIVKPAPSAVYEGHVDIEISLPNVPHSYLGLEEEQQRCFVWINEELLGLDSFVVATVLGPEGSRFDAPPPPGPPASSFLTVGGTLGKGSIGAIRPGNALLNSRLELHDRAALLRRSSPATRPRPATGPTTAVRTRTEGSDRVRSLLMRGGGKQTGRGSGLIAGGVIGSGMTQPAFIGRDIRPSDVARFGELEPAGLRLSARLPASRFNEGINTLSVAVVDGRDRFEIRKSVAFMALPAAPPKTGGVTRPGVFTLPDREMPPLLATRLLKHVAARAPHQRPSAPGRKPKPRPSKHDRWVPLSSDLKPRLESSRVQIAQRMDQRVRQMSDTRAAIKGGRARPVVAARVPLDDRPPDRPKGDKPSKQSDRGKDKGGKGKK